MTPQQKRERDRGGNKNLSNGHAKPVSLINSLIFLSDWLSSFSFQVGRSSESPIDFVVMDTLPGDKKDAKVMQSTISRFACRILVNRCEPSKARIFAAGFDSSRNIFLGVSIFYQIEVSVMAHIPSSTPHLTSPHHSTSFSLQFSNSKPCQAKSSRQVQTAHSVFSMRFPCTIYH